MLRSADGYRKLEKLQRTDVVSPLGLKPEDFAAEVNPALTPAYIHDAWSYYYDHRDEIEREMAANTEETARQQIRALLRSDEDYARMMGQPG